MALSDLQVFSEYTYGAFTEVLAQQVDLFNAATDGALVMTTEAIQGDYSDTVFYAAVSGLVRRRNPYGDGPIAEKVLSQKTDTVVKVAAGTPPVRMDRAWWNWIKRDPAEAAAVMGQQLAKQSMADMLNVAIGCVSAAVLNLGSVVVNDISGDAGTAALPSPLALGNTSILFGDRQSDILCWIMHSKSWNDLYGNALTNAERLFSYGTVNVLVDPMGRRYVVSDQPGLMVPAGAGGTATFHTLGLTAGAVEIMAQDDYEDNYSSTNGNENIKTTYQAEWSYGVGVKGFSWDKANGGHAPTDAALFTGTNWDQNVTSIKDTAGVMLVSK